MACILSSKQERELYFEALDEWLNAVDFWERSVLRRALQKWRTSPGQQQKCERKENGFALESHSHENSKDSSTPEARRRQENPQWHTRPLRPKDAPLVRACFRWISTCCRGRPYAWRRPPAEALSAALSAGMPLYAVRWRVDGRSSSLWPFGESDKVWPSSGSVVRRRLIGRLALPPCNVPVLLYAHALADGAVALACFRNWAAPALANRRRLAVLRALRLRRSLRLWRGRASNARSRSDTVAAASIVAAERTAHRALLRWHGQARRR
ncbi:unnamed protein product, partial [Phaeothamnion confervicola]